MRILSVFVVTALLAGVLCSCKKTEEPEPDVTPDPHEGMVEVSDGSGGMMWVNEAAELTPFALDTSAFSVTDGVAAYAGEDCTLIRGIDVSDHQGTIDWQAVAASGVEFAIIRCGWRGYGGGSLNEDGCYRQNIEGAKAAGLKVGAYFFSQATSLVEAAEEAVYTVSLLEGYALDLPVFFDWERIDSDTARTDNVDGRTVTEAALEFCRLVGSAGYDTGVYTYLNLAYFTYELNSLKGITLWLGDPGTWPEFYYEHDYWQYSFTGSVPGIEGDVDMDVIYRRTAPQAEGVSQTSEGQT